MHTDRLMRTGWSALMRGVIVYGWVLVASACATTARADVAPNRARVTNPARAQVPRNTGTDADFVLRLRSGSYLLREKQMPVVSVDGPAQVYIQFYAMPSQLERDALAQGGVVLRDYVNANTFQALIPSARIHDILARKAVRAIGGIPIEDKVDPRLLGTASEGARQGVLVLMIQFHKDVDIATAAPTLIEVHGGSVKSTMRLIHTLLVQLPPSELQAVAHDPSVAWVEAAMPPMEPLSHGQR